MMTLEEHLDELMGPIGTPERDKFEIKHLFWEIRYHTKFRRKEFGFTHEDLAARTGLDIKEIIQIERGGVNTPISNVAKVWKQLGICYDGDICYYRPEWTKQKPPVKKKLTKPSRSLRTLVR